MSLFFRSGIVMFLSVTYLQVCVSCTFLNNVYFSCSLKYINVAMVTVLKNVTNVITAVGEMYLFGKHHDNRVWAALFLMVDSIFEYCYKDQLQKAQFMLFCCMQQLCKRRGRKTKIKKNPQRGNLKVLPFTVLANQLKRLHEDKEWQETIML